MGMTVEAAQADMREGYYSGAAGILASALAWSVAAGFAFFATPREAIWALLVGGMLIHPVGVLICKGLGARGAHTKGNPLGLLAGASTFWLIFSLPLAYVVGLQTAAFFFVAMLLVIGGRYLVFGTIYGMKLYWALGLSLAAAACLLAVLGAKTQYVALAGAALEWVFGIACLAQHRRQQFTNPAPRGETDGP